MLDETRSGIYQSVTVTVTVTQTTTSYTLFVFNPRSSDELHYAPDDEVIGKNQPYSSNLELKVDKDREFVFNKSGRTCEPPSP